MKWYYWVPIIGAGLPHFDFHKWNHDWISKPRILNTFLIYHIVCSLGALYFLIVGLADLIFWLIS